MGFPAHLGPILVPWPRGNRRGRALPVQGCGTVGRVHRVAPAHVLARQVGRPEGPRALEAAQVVASRAVGVRPVRPAGVSPGVGGPRPATAVQVVVAAVQVVVAGARVEAQGAGSGGALEGGHLEGVSRSVPSARNSTIWQLRRSAG